MGLGLPFLFNVGNELRYYSQSETGIYKQRKKKTHGIDLAAEKLTN